MQNVTRKGKDKYKKKMEKHFMENNMKKAWDGMNNMSGYGGGKSKTGDGSTAEMDPNSLNQFYARFD